MSKRKTKILSTFLYAGAIYFLAVALVHATGLKVPGLFVYYNVPSYAYQDRIIAFLAFGWAVMFYHTGRTLDLKLIDLMLTIGFVALVSLSANTLISNFNFIRPFTNKLPYYIIIKVLFIYWLSLVYFRLKQSRSP